MKTKQVSGAADFARNRRVVCKRCLAVLEPTPSGFLVCPSGDRGLVTLQVIYDALDELEREIRARRQRKKPRCGASLEA